MSFLEDIIESFTGNKRASAQAIVNTSKELEGLEQWIEEADIDPDNIHVAVGKDIIEKDIYIYEKANKVVIRLERSLSGKWDEERANDIRQATLDLLVMKYVVAVGEGFDFNESSSASYPEIAKLASLDVNGLQIYFQDATESIQDLYEKYFPRG